MGGSQNDDYTQNIFSNSQPLGPSPLIFIFLIDMVRQSRVGRSAKKGKKTLARTFKDTKLKRILILKSAGLSRAATVFIVCERICKLKHSVCEKQNTTNSMIIHLHPDTWQCFLLL